VVIVLSTEVLDTTLGPRDELLLLAFGRDRASSGVADRDSRSALLRGGLDTQDQVKVT